MPEQLVRTFSNVLPAGRHKLLSDASLWQRRQRKPRSMNG